MHKLSLSGMMSKITGHLSLHRSKSKSNIESTKRLNNLSQLSNLAGKKVFYTNPHTGQSGFGIVAHDSTSFFDKSGMPETGYAISSLAGGALKVTDGKLGQGGEMQGMRIREASTKEKQNWNKL
ncbi:MAG: hypothetical protein RLZZ210_1264 [Pseudomonadota bacterium]|jgi:hypothetical protein